MYEPLKGQLVLELFPGAGLFGKAFEFLGATVVRGPDILWGGDIHEFEGVKGKFDGVIGGPPCQIFSGAAFSGTRATNLIPDFLRVVDECEPAWAVMENVPAAKDHGPDWDSIILNDYNLGGNTFRNRMLWFKNIKAPDLSKVEKRAGKPTNSVLASSWKMRSIGGKTHFTGHEKLSAFDADDLQGFPGLGEKIFHAQPEHMRKERLSIGGVSKTSRNILAVHMLGNGVPFAMGLYVAMHVASELREKNIELQ